MLECQECGGAGVIDSGGTTPWGAEVDRQCDICLGAGFAFAADAARLIVSEGDRIDLEAAYAGVVEQSMEAETAVRLEEYARLIARAYEEARRQQPEGS